MAVEVNVDALASASLSISLGILEILVKKGVIDKDEALAMFDEIASSKESKSTLYDSDAEAEAAALIAGLRKRLATRL